jgi:aminoglycoside phosphotransferase (APT) family kinase protein
MDMTRTSTLIASRLAEAWPGATQAAEPAPLTGGFWASMYRLRVDGQPRGVPADLVFRIAPDPALGAKEVAVQRTVAELGFATPRVRLAGPADDDLGGSWSVTDFATGAPPLGDLGAFAALRRAPGLFGRLPGQLAGPMAALHTLDPDAVTWAVDAGAPGAVWHVEDLVERFASTAEALGRADLARAIGALGERMPPEGRTVVCHGDLHPLNLLVDAGGAVTLVDWTAAIRAEPAYDVAFTSLLLANPPLHAPGPLRAVIRRVGARMAARFVARYRTLVPDHDLTPLDWYRALHGARILVEAATLDARGLPEVGRHPFQVLVPVGTATLGGFTGSPLTLGS